jgi:lysozyme family protein
MTEDELIDDVFTKEGRTYGDQHTRPPIDQPTAPGGIILATLSEYLGRPATLAELRALTPDTARPIVQWKLRTLAAVQGFDRITFEPLQLQMIDFGYNSPPALAIRWLQRVLRVPRTGRMDETTIAALAISDGFLVNQALIAARLQMIDLWTDAAAQRKAWEEGLESRGLSFSLLVIP